MGELTIAQAEGAQLAQALVLQQARGHWVDVARDAQRVIQIDGMEQPTERGHPHESCQHLAVLGATRVEQRQLLAVGMGLAVPLVQPHRYPQDGASPRFSAAPRRSVQVWA